ncbi:23S rRNA (guanosine(2251)-2'-O)-methyltransferase RlmB [Hypericibacter adhaerens]|uniref:23S rRNA (Guanosine(2251)-2'-O)-methyltransferase RlmB n=1 Tax=Hypericibacter adhaerens TaxID=2602016 RepID=A0A5J6MWL6_9PROT|nr:23S rRNA (guanosine(2251)-2'-O)-methyltransferase RlmB [Hypericibacter adhaerens]
MRKGKPRFPQSRSASNRRPETDRSSAAPPPSGTKPGRSPGGRGADSPRRPAGPAPGPLAPEPERDRPRRPPPERAGTSGFWLFGLHAVRAALANPRRHIHRILVIRELAGELFEGIDRSARPRPLPTPESMDKDAIGRLLPAGAVHQGVAARVEPLPYIALEDLTADLDPNAPALLVVLDQVSDPHNVGAILRSAAAFGASAVIVTERHAAPETGTLAKSASGALDVVPLVRVANLARALELLKKANIWCLGFAADAPDSLPEAKLADRVALVLGSEGQGMRRLTREGCDLLLRLPTGGPIDQLNVSNAAAIALYEWARQHRQPR